MSVTKALSHGRDERSLCSLIFGSSASAVTRGRKDFASAVTRGRKDFAPAITRRKRTFACPAEVAAYTSEQCFPHVIFKSSIYIAEYSNLSNV